MLALVLLYSCGGKQTTTTKKAGVFLCVCSGASVSAGTGTGFIISINVREAGFKTETAEGKLQRVPRHQDGIPGSVVSDDSIPLPLHELPQLHAFLPV